MDGFKGQYRLEGKSIGSCGCKTALSCFCWNQSASSCGSFVAYHILKGEIQGVDVSCLSLVRVVPESAETSLIYLDSHGNSTQQELLLQAFTGKLGGILHDLHNILSQNYTVKIAPIQFVNEPRKRATLQIGNVLIQEKVQEKLFCFEA
jgi:hypothetical protein